MEIPPRSIYGRRFEIFLIVFNKFCDVCENGDPPRSIYGRRFEIFLTLFNKFCDVFENGDSPHINLMYTV
jgi:hypothetical protein